MTPNCLCHFWTTAPTRSQQQVRRLMGAKTVDSESEWQTDHTLHQQQSQTTERQSSTPQQHLRFHSGVITLLFSSSSHLNSPRTLYRPVHNNTHTRIHTRVQGEAGERSLHNNTVQMFINVQTHWSLGQHPIDPPWSMVFISFVLKSSIRCFTLGGRLINGSKKEILD